MERWEKALWIGGGLLAALGVGAAIYHFSPTRPETHARKAWRRGKAGKPMYSFEVPSEECVRAVFNDPKWGDTKREATVNCKKWIKESYEAGKAGKDWPTTHCDVLGVC